MVAKIIKERKERGEERWGWDEKDLIAQSIEMSDKFSIVIDVQGISNKYISIKMHNHPLNTQCLWDLSSCKATWQALGACEKE